jgi:hypothetical protein
LNLFFKSRRKKLVDLYQHYYKRDSPCETDEVLREHPKLELYEAILISGYLEQSKTPKEFEDAVKRLEIK